MIKLKNEFHDLLGHRLSLFKGYLDSDKACIDDIKYMISNLFCDDSRMDSSLKLKKLVDIYDVLGINVDVCGELPRGEGGDIFFEIIREGVTNAVLHGGSKNINVDIDDFLMTVSNDGVLPSGEIVYGDGIKGMKRKLALFGGYLVIECKEKFVLKIKIEKKTLI